MRCVINFKRGSKRLRMCKRAVSLCIGHLWQVNKPHALCFYVQHSDAMFAITHPWVAKFPRS